LLFFLLWVLVYATPSHGQESFDREYSLKGSFILKLTQFIEWPQDVIAPSNLKNLNLCIIGKDPFGNIFDLAKEEAILSRNLVIKHFIEIDVKNQCHVLFVSSSEKDRIDEIIQATQNEPILLIGDTLEYAERGIGINLIIINNNIRLQINPSVVHRKGINISSELLNLAIIVSKRGHDENR